MADVVIGQLEAAALVVGLLRDDAIEADQPARQRLHAGLPQGQAMTPPAPGRAHDVKADEAEALAIAHGRDHADRFIAQQADEIALRVGRMKGVGIVQTRVPAFCCGPIDAQIELGA